MSGAVIATMAAGLASTVVFVTTENVANGNDTANGAQYSVPAAAGIGDIVIFYCLGNAQGQGSNPPGNGWTDASRGYGVGTYVYVKKMATAGDLTATRSGTGGYVAFTVYRGAAAFAVVSENGFTRSPYHAGVAFWGGVKPAPATWRLTMNGNGNPASAIASDILPPLSYINGTNYAQYSAIEFRSQ